MRKLKAQQIEKFGQEIPLESKTNQAPFEDTYEKMYKFYRLGQLEEMKTAVNTVLIYMRNLLSDFGNPKFKKINRENPNYQKRVGQTVGGE